MTSAAAARRLAEDEIVIALDALTVSDALGALTEVMAQVLADHHVRPGTDAYAGFLLTLARSLTARTETLCGDARVEAH